MTEKQVLFRIDSKLLDSLDRKLAKDGFTTRNAWFKEVVSGYAKASRAPKATGKSAKASKPAARKKAAKR